MESKLRQLRGMLFEALNDPNRIPKRKVRKFIMNNNLDTYPDGRDMLGSVMPANESGNLNDDQIFAIITRMDHILNPRLSDDIIVLSTAGPGYEFR